MNLQGQCGTRHTDWSKIDIREDGKPPPPAQTLSAQFQRIEVYNIFKYI